MEEAASVTLVDLGCAVRFMTPVERAVDVILLRPLGVVRHKKIQLAIFVVVHPGGARAKAGIIHTRGVSDVLERAVVLVVEKARFAHPGNVDVIPAVVVVVSRRHPHTVQSNIQPRLGRYIRKRAVAVVVI